MATGVRRSGVGDALLGEGRVTRSQSTYLGVGVPLGAPAAVDVGKAPSGCGSGGRRAAAKKRAALVDVTNAANAGARAAASRAKPVVSDAVDLHDVQDGAPIGGAMLTRRRAASMDKLTLPCATDLRTDVGGAAPMETDAQVDFEVMSAMGGALVSAGRAGTAVASAAVGPSGAGYGDAAAWKDVDAAHGEDPLFCTAYVHDIYTNLRLAEQKHRPSTVYMDTVQTDINATMRGILVDWLVEVAEEYKLVPDTLFLSVAYIDRCLSSTAVQRAQLQLVGVTCMLIAAKYEEIYAPQVDEFCYITDNTYTREQVLDMERHLLGVLSFELTQPTCKSFLRRFLRAAEADHKAEFLACFLAELSLLDYGFLGHLPSCVAASCVLVALWTLRRPAWNVTLVHYTGYRPAQLRECATQLVELFAGAKRQTLPAVREKYSATKFKCVSSLSPPSEGLPASLWM